MPNSYVYSIVDHNLLSGMLGVFGVIMVVITLYYITKPSHKKKTSKNDLISTKDTENKSPDEFILIGVTGRKKSGKDTIGKYLIDNHGFVRVAFADSLKKACKHIFGFTEEQLYDDTLKEVVDEYWQHSPREILQKVGTELFRIELPHLCKNISSDIWIRSVDRKIRKLRSEGHTRFVITDVRFDNELEYITKLQDYIKKKHGYTWKVSRPSLLLNADPSVPIHASEALIDDFICDEHFVNESTIDELYDSVETKIHDVFTKILVNK